jgi:uncharacterized protein YndB with AHSA1/START domain
METPQFVYTTYIATTPEKLWEALTNPGFTEQYWSESRVESDWVVGSPVRHMRGETLMIAGEVLVCDPPSHLAYTWSVRHIPGYANEPPSRVDFEIEPLGADVRLTVTHRDLAPATLTLISGGWPLVLSSLKSLLETGRALHVMRLSGQIVTR